VVAEIESELPYPLTQVAQDIRAALARKSFHDRITDRLAADGSWPRPLSRATLVLVRR
jgi:hypothetical protein